MRPLTIGSAMAMLLPACASREERPFPVCMFWEGQGRLNTASSWVLRWPEAKGFIEVGTPLRKGVSVVVYTAGDGRQWALRSDEAPAPATGLRGPG